MNAESRPLVAASDTMVPMRALTLSLIGAIVVLWTAYLFKRMHEYRVELAGCEAQHNAPVAVQAAVQRQKEEDAAQWEARLKNADYVLWEVHEIDPRAPDSAFRDLCTTVGVHSVDWVNTSLMGYSVFDDAHGHKQLTCRWLKEKEDAR